MYKCLLQSMSLLTWFTDRFCKWNIHQSKYFNFWKNKKKIFSQFPIKSLLSISSEFMWIKILLFISIIVTKFCFGILFYFFFLFACFWWIELKVNHLINWNNYFINIYHQQSFQFNHLGWIFFFLLCAFRFNWHFIFHSQRHHSKHFQLN